MPVEILWNPDFAGQKPRLLRPQCHDQTPFISFACLCGAKSHMHESQLEAVAQAGGDEIVLRCHACGGGEPVPVTVFRQAFADMRREGWIE